MPSSIPLICLISLGMLAGLVRPVFAYHSEDPKILAAVGKGVRFLESLSDNDLQAGTWGGEDYHVVICAYAHFKARHDPSTPLVSKGVRQARKLAARMRSTRGKPQGAPGAANKSTYELCVSILLLCEVDAKQYRNDIETLRDSLFGLQHPNGAFGYLGESKGDTSQVQYVVLAMWTMDQKGIKVPETRVNAVHSWLMRVQDLDGAWPYRADDPGKGKGLIKQGTKYMSHSTALAGASSVLIAADYFQQWREKKRVNAIPPGVPKAVFVAGEVPLPGAGRKAAAQVQGSDILSAVDRMNRYRNKSPYKRTSWHYYSIYSLERFESFHEFAKGKIPPEPPWYNKVVAELLSSQSSSGGWGIGNDSSSSTPPVATAFAVLFLVRSTAAAIAQSNSGTLAGGFGLPSDTTKIRVDGTQIKGEVVAEAVEGLLDMLEGDDPNALEGKSLPEDMELATEPKARAAQMDRLERLVRGSQSWQARRVAARLLGQSDEMRVVPSLIFALSDPDSMVRLFARDGLRFISRKFEGFEMPRKPNYAELRKAQREWREWYLTMDPGYVFLDD